MNWPAGTSTRRTSERNSRQFSRCSITSNATTRSKHESTCGSEAHDPCSKARCGRRYSWRANWMASAETSQPVTSCAVLANSAEPYPAPQPASSTRLPRASRAAKAYRARCSLSRSGSTRPGIMRSPVNSANGALRQDGLRRWAGAQPRIDLDTAGHMEVAVNLAFGMRHLHRDGIVDPVAHLVSDQSAVGDGR